MPTLTDLPVELVEQILTDVADRPKYGSSGRTSRPLAPFEDGGYDVGLTCKHLLGIWQSVVLRHVELSSYRILNRFCKRLRVDLLALVHSLHLSVSAGDQDGGTPSARTVKTLFDHLTNVTELTIANSPRLADLFLFPQLDSSPLPRLQSVVLQNTLAADVNPLDPRNFVYLDFYTKLDALTMQLRDGWSGPAHEPLEWRLPDTSKSWYISLSGRIGGNLALDDLISFFPTIDTLLLDNTKSFGSTLPSLGAVEDLSALTALSLKNHSPAVFQDPSPCLSLFPHLESLELSGQYLLLTLLPVLHTLPNLRRLVLGRNGKFDVADLEKLFEGPERLPSLRTLRLDVVHKKVNAGETGYLGWMSKFTREGVKDLDDLARAHNVKLSGLAVGLSKLSKGHYAALEKR